MLSWGSRIIFIGFCLLRMCVCVNVCSGNTTTTTTVAATTTAVAFNVSSYLCCSVWTAIVCFIYTVVYSYNFVWLSCSPDKSIVHKWCVRGARVSHTWHRDNERRISHHFFICCWVIGKQMKAKSHRIGIAQGEVEAPVDPKGKEPKVLRTLMVNQTSFSIYVGRNTY